MSSNKKFDTLFLDRDGVLNKKIDNGYVLDFDQIEILPGIEDFLQSAVNYFERILVVTNQRCVGRGLLSIEHLFEINAKINELTGGHIDRFYVCPHLDEDNCDCRKPKNGMFLQAGKDYEVDFSCSSTIDSISYFLIINFPTMATAFAKMERHYFTVKLVKGIYYA